MATPSILERVLVVDDDEGLLILMAGALQDEGFAVSTAKSGAAAFEAIASTAPDLMLLDMKLQDMDGTALVRKMREKSLSIPFVVVTGRGDAKEAVESMREGALDYMMKDTGLLDLLPSVVRRALMSVGRDRALAAAQAESRRLEQEIVAISELERLTIGAELHDGLGQQLTAIELICTGLKEDVSKVRPELGARISEMGKLLREAIAQTRVLSRGLVPVGNDPDSLHESLAELAERMGSSRRIKCRMESKEPVKILNATVAGHLYRIAQEALNNAVRHSKASEIRIGLRRGDGAVILSVSDDGVGLPKFDSRRTGVGMRMMRHRASLIGAKIDIAARKGGGVVVTCTLPDRV
jgi:signal transduction histidine kinase